MKLSANSGRDMTICSIILLAFYLCAGLVFLCAGASPGLIQTSEESVSPIDTINVFNTSFIPFVEQSQTAYNPSELYQVALKIYSGLTIIPLCVLMLITFAQSTIRYAIAKRKGDDDVEYPDVLPSIACMFTWCVPALVLNIVGKWMVCNQDFSAEQMLSDIAGLDSLVSLQLVTLGICAVCYAVPVIIEIVSSFREKAE